MYTLDLFMSMFRCEQCERGTSYPKDCCCNSRRRCQRWSCYSCTHALMFFHLPNHCHRLAGVVSNLRLRQSNSNTGWPVTLAHRFAATVAHDACEPRAKSQICNSPLFCGQPIQLDYQLLNEMRSESSLT